MHPSKIDMANILQCTTVSDSTCTTQPNLTWNMVMVARQCDLQPFRKVNFGKLFVVYKVTWHRNVGGDHGIFFKEHSCICMNQ